MSGFKFTAPVKRFVEATSSEPILKVATTQNKFQLSVAAMRKMDLKGGEVINILHNAEAEDINEAFALAILGGGESGAVITIPKNASRGEFSYSGKYGMMIAMDTQIDYSPEELVEKGILEKSITTAGNTKYTAMKSVVADIADAIEIEVEGEEDPITIYPLVNFRQVDKIIRSTGEVDDEFQDMDDAEDMDV